MARNRARLHDTGSIRTMVRVPNCKKSNTSEDKTMEMPTIKCYHKPSGKNAMRIDLGQTTVWFSYKTLIAFVIHGGPEVIRENQWGNTTGRHLNAIDGGSTEAKAARVSAKRFKELWQAS